MAVALTERGGVDEHMDTEQRVHGTALSEAKHAVLLLLLLLMLLMLRHGLAIAS